MPNWCSNDIEITGPRDKIRALWDATQAEGSGLLNALVPMPDNIFLGNLGEEERKMCEEQGIPNWYDWSVSNWGTKWDVDPEGLEYSEDGDTATISGWMDTAWAPPVEAVQTYGEANPDVSITLNYNEGGMCFVGQYVIENGCGFDDCVDYSSATADTVRDIIGEAYDDHWNLSEQMAEWEEDFDDA